MKMIYIPSDMAEMYGYKEETTYENDIKIDGTLSDNGKYLTIGNLQYFHSSYLQYLNEGITQILIDPKTNREYKIDGTPAGNSDLEYVRENRINTSKYKIIDKKTVSNDDEKIEPVDEKNKANDNNQINNNTDNQTNNDVDNQPSNDTNNQQSNEINNNNVDDNVKKRLTDEFNSTNIEFRYDESVPIVTIYLSKFWSDETFEINNVKYKIAGLTDLEMKNVGQNCYNVKLTDKYGNIKKSSKCIDFKPLNPNFSFSDPVNCSLTLFSDDRYDSIHTYNYLSNLQIYIDGNLLNHEGLGDSFTIPFVIPVGNHTIEVVNKYGLSNSKSFDMTENEYLYKNYCN
jgi:hypothetical protein